MRSRVVGLVAAAALLASLGIANAAENAAEKAKGPVKLTDNQLDKVTAGATAADMLTAAEILAFSTATLNMLANANSAAALNNLLAITNQTVGFLSGSAVTP